MTFFTFNNQIFRERDGAPLRYRVFGQCCNKEVAVANTRCPVALTEGARLKSKLGLLARSGTWEAQELAT